MSESSEGGRQRSPGIFTGIALFFEGARMLRRERSLWRYGIVPVVFSLLAVSGAIGLVSWNADTLLALVTSWMPAIEVTAWYQWLWLGPARAALVLIGWLLFLACAAVAVLVALLVANVASAPFLDALSQGVERIEVGAAVEGEGGLRALLAEGRRSVVAELQRAAFFGGVWLLILAVGLIPGAQLVSGPALVVFTVLFLPLDYSGYALDRRAIPFRRRRRWVFGNWGLMAGFGASAFASCLVPGLNFLLVPAFVVGGTLLALRHPPT